MKIESRENKIVLKEVYESIILETRNEKKLFICMRDSGFEMKIDNGDWHMIEKESDFSIRSKAFQSKFSETKNRNLISVKVPIDSQDYFINNAGCLRYSTNEGKESSCVEPAQIGEFLENDKHKIIGSSIFEGSKIVIIEIK